MKRIPTTKQEVTAPEIINNQRKIKLDLQPFREFCEKVVGEIPAAFSKTFTLTFVSDRKMRGLNKMFRGINFTTDVLSFPFEADEFEPDANNLGDIVISIEQASRQASDNQLTIETEIKQLILHGILHLCGFDHEADAGEMNSIEMKLRDKLEIS